MSSLSLENFIAQCRRDSPAVIEARGLTAQDVSDAALRLSAEGIAARILDGSALNTKAALLDAIAAAFQFPGYFGRNWDALIDCWSDMSWLPARGYVCFIEKADVLERTQQELLDELRKIAGFVSERWKNEDPSFKVANEEVLFKLALIYDTQA